MGLKRKQPGIANLALYIVGGQILAFVLTMLGMVPYGVFVLVPELVLKGEVWRVATFLFAPPNVHPLFLAFAWYLFWIMSSALESTWGHIRFTRYLLIGWAATVALSFLSPNLPYFNWVWMSSVFLAFAWLNPRFELMLFFVLPVQIKWLALLTWLTYAWLIIDSGLWGALLVCGGTANFFVFFGRELFSMGRSARWKAQRNQESKRLAAEPFHRCVKCGATDLSDPDLQFYYEGGEGICEGCLKGRSKTGAGL